LGGVVIFLAGLSFVIPLLKKDKVAKQVGSVGESAVEAPYTDYRGIARPREQPIVRQEGGVPEFADLPVVESDENNEGRLPEQSPLPAQPVARVSGGSGGGGGGYSGYVRPDTRTDSLRGKNILGIKGLTPTQKQYLDGTGVVAEPVVAGAAVAENPYAKYGLPPKDEYIASILAATGAGGAGGVPAGGYSGYQSSPYSVYGGQLSGGVSNYNAQNDQSGKLQFYQQGRENVGQGAWLPQAAVWQGTIFDATLLSDINTDLPGECVAIISKNIYSSLDGKHLIIPQNSRLLGTYNSSISYSQSRVQVGWHTLIRPDGYAISLGNMQATDQKGAVGLPGIINDHPFQYLKVLALISAFRVLTTELDNTAASSDNQYVQNLAADTQSVINTFSAKIIDRAMDVQPTIVIKAGTKINIVTNNTLMLPPLEPYPVSKPYHR
jgi:type IV secretion system protein VirB10